MAFAVARKSIFSDSIDEHVSMISVSKFLGMGVGSGACDVGIRNQVSVCKWLLLLMTYKAVEEEVVVVGH